MRRIHAGAALGLLLLLACCGTAQPGSGNGAVTSTSLPMPTGDFPTGLNHATPDPTVVELRPTRFDRATAGDGDNLVVQYTAGGRAECAKLGRVDVAETDDAVTVTVRLGQAPGAKCGGEQPMIAATFETTVTLKAPLGARQVRDGAS
ncbi:hypothetical protein [Kutzneria sp. 744]|uniref:hypothetical protein n=1 Tax=Kutzneria sp. (strain 744) TaxID=345341 RepID=UPI0003EEBEDB|nr:hypothetical protein [Kutzneria sp. 744]EWM09810.1 hypothetical protein KUTG_00114 [Kutzneria sp. 744]